MSSSLTSLVEMALLKYNEDELETSTRLALYPDKCFGKPCIRGLRMPVASIVATWVTSGCSKQVM